MRTRVAGALAALLALAACVEFADPVGIGLARDTRVELAFDLVDDPRLASCSGVAPVPAGSAALCVQATVVPGINRLGERLRVLDDTLRVMGLALTPAGGSPELLVYQHRFAVPLAAVDTTAYTATLPRVAGVDILPRGVRWYAVARVDPDTVVRAPGAGVRLRVRPPGGASTPRPTFQFWAIDVASDTAVAAYNAMGVPRPHYDFPAEVLAALGGSRFAGELRWSRSYSQFGQGLQLSVRFNQRLRWTILTR